MLNNLGTSYEYRSRHLGELPDSDKAIEYQTKAVMLTPDGRASKPGWLYNLGMSYKYRFEHLGEFSDLEGARSSFENAARLILINPAAQISRCARKWALCSSLLGCSPRIAYEQCLELIPHLI